MLVAMVDVGEMMMAVRDRQVPVAMTMRLVAGPARIVLVLVVLVVPVAMSVLQIVMRVLMAVLLRTSRPSLPWTT